MQIAVVGKYTGLKDAYKSLIEALHHGGIANKVKVNLDWIESETFEREDPAPYLEGMSTASSCPAASASAAPRARSRRRRFARERQIPYFGICFGMQMAVIEATRNLAGVKDANSTEFGATPEPVVGLLTEWMRGNELETAQRRRRSRRHHAARRLSRHLAGRQLAVARIYGGTEISERHRHRYEVNMAYRERLEGKGLRFSGMSPDGILPEIVEYADHPWFIGVQYHPELKSRPFEPHPLFESFIGAAVEQSRLM